MKSKYITISHKNVFESSQLTEKSEKSISKKKSQVCTIHVRERTASWKEAGKCT